jgi:hypothetical protein
LAGEEERTLLTWMNRMERMKSLKLISREDARTAKRVKILTRKDFAGVTAQPG